ncbi:DUF1045 domain-containing protein [Aquabacter sp. CN5-332]|uniref:DUF1045 domain-containing protein n=1 Tax=Aquabacter sp. CN5-332 TaxID=3156608 RepID=UPI0032B521C6
MSVRYAVYLAPPPDSFLWAFGSSILGYDAASGGALTPPDLPGFDAETWHDLTAEPRRYGFHGTLKAPFRLAEGRSEADLFSALAEVAQEHHGFELGALSVREIGTFIALVPSGPVPALLDLAGCAVVDLDAYRAPLSEQEIARRRPNGLSPRQREYLDRYGYPYVLEEFRFHMTLTGSLEDGVRSHACNALSEAFIASGANMPLEVFDLALYRQDAPDERFRIVHRTPLRRV